MIIEQIRYFIHEENRDEVLETRRRVTRLRSQLGLPPGYILVADAMPDDAPALIWQCGYEHVAAMAAATTALMGNAEYEAARDRLGSLAVRVELELYMTDEDEEAPGE
jgi:hypothetical protein